MFKTIFNINLSLVHSPSIHGNQPNHSRRSSAGSAAPGAPSDPGQVHMKPRSQSPDIRGDGTAKLAQHEETDDENERLRLKLSETSDGLQLMAAAVAEEPAKIF